MERRKFTRELKPEAARIRPRDFLDNPALLVAERPPMALARRWDDRSRQR